VNDVEEGTASEEGSSEHAYSRAVQEAYFEVVDTSLEVL